VVSSCDKSEDQNAKQASAPKAAPEIFEFGFRLKDFTVIHDTVSRGDTFGSILQEQQFTPSQIHHIVEAIRDTFDVRRIRAGKPFTLFKNKTGDSLQALVYQPDRLSYFVV